MCPDPVKKLPDPDPDPVGFEKPDPDPAGQNHRIRPDPDPDPHHCINRLGTGVSLDNKHPGKWIE